jgi:cobalt-zinc-cadmium efflux system outer membrane protein
MLRQGFEKRAMPRPGVLLAAMVFMLSAGPTRPACAQITSLADDIILITKGQNVQEDEAARSRLGNTIGGDASLLGPMPGAGEQIFQLGSPGAGGSSPKSLNRGDVLSSVTREGHVMAQHVVERINPPQQQNLPPVYGPLELPVADDPGPPNGLTLDQAINRLVAANHELRSKFFEIPQARADVLTASLRANPLVFGSVSNVPYGSFGPNRPGNIGYSGTVIYPFDVSGKRLARTDVAAQELRVIEAQYQDAVRLEIETLHGAYLEVLVARETLRFTTASRDGLLQVSRLGATQYHGKAISRPDFDRIEIQAESAEIAVEQATAALRQAKQALGVLLDFRPDEADLIELHAALRDLAPQPPAENELIALAEQSRPDLNAYRLGLKRAHLDVRLAEAEKTSDVFMLYTPWQLQDNSPTSTQNSTGWSVAVFGSVPLFNRNQGNIRRAELNVRQTGAELAAVTHHIEVEVGAALAEYQASRQAVERIERTILPRSTRIRDASLNLLRQGEASALDYLNAQRDHNDVVRQYRDALIRHRRAMLRLNTAVGMRVLP